MSVTGLGSSGGTPNQAPIEKMPEEIQARIASFLHPYEAPAVAARLSVTSRTMETAKWREVSAHSQAPIEKVPKEIRANIASFLSPYEAAAVGARLASTSHTMRGNEWNKKELTKRNNSLEKLNQARRWNSQPIKDMAKGVTRTAAPLVAATALANHLADENVLAQNACREYSDCQGRYALNFMENYVLSPLHWQAYQEASCGGGFGFQPTYSYCVTPGCQTYHTVGQTAIRQELNCTSLSKAVFDCSTSRVAIGSIDLLRYPLHSLHHQYQSPCILKSYGAAVFKKAGGGFGTLIPDVQSFISQKLKDLAQPQRLANMAMAGAEVAVDSASALIEMGTGREVPEWMRAAAKVGAVFGVAAATGTSVVHYAWGRAGVYAASRLFTYFK